VRGQLSLACLGLAVVTYAPTVEYLERQHLVSHRCRRPPDSLFVATRLREPDGHFATVPGQIVQVRKRDLTGDSAPAAITLTTDRLRLRATRLTAAVSGAPSGSNFNIANLPGLFTANGITLIQVQTSSKTNFENVSHLSGSSKAPVSRSEACFRQRPDSGTHCGQS